jgi:hypothetical protein
MVVVPVEPISVTATPTSAPTMIFAMGMVNVAIRAEIGLIMFPVEHATRSIQEMPTKWLQDHRAVSNGQLKWEYEDTVDDKWDELVAGHSCREVGRKKIGFRNG